jgi:hypothetical protein
VALSHKPFFSRLVSHPLRPRSLDSVSAARDSDQGRVRPRLSHQLR